MVLYIGQVQGYCLVCDRTGEGHSKAVRKELTQH